MSRTFRKKGYELERTKDKSRTKYDGYDFELNTYGPSVMLKLKSKGITKVSRFYVGMPWLTLKNFRYYCQEVYYNPSKQEFYKEYYRIHGETKRSDSEFRQFVLGKVNKASRMTARKKLKLFMLDDEYEVMLKRKERFIKEWFE